MRKICSMPSEGCSSRTSRVQGRLVSLRRPLRTGPGQPKHAARICFFSSGSVRKSLTTSSSEANWPAGYLWSRTGTRRPASKLKSARWTLVPPTSPARIMEISAKLLRLNLQRAYFMISGIGRGWKLGCGDFVEQEQQLATCGPDKLRWQTLRIARAGHDLGENVG